MSVDSRLVRLIHRMEGGIAEAARAAVWDQGLPKVARSQLKLAVAAAQQAESLAVLKAFLAYQASRDLTARPDKQVWGHESGRMRFVQRAWKHLLPQIKACADAAYETYGLDLPEGNPAQWEAFRCHVALLFFAHLDRAVRISEDPGLRGFYGEGEQSQAQGGGRDGK